MMDAETFALIVGGGPVGLAAAIELYWRAVPAVLVTDKLDTAQHPKCNNTNARSMEHFRRLGIADELRSEGLPPHVERASAYALLRPRVRTPAAPVFRLADAGNSQQRSTDGARARVAALRRASKRRANPFRLAAQFVCRASRPCGCRSRERADRRAATHHVAISPGHRRRQQYGAPCARLRD